MSCRDEATEVADRVFAEIERVPRVGGRDQIPPRALLDLPEPSATPPSRSVAAAVLIILLALASLVDLKQRIAPPNVHAEPPAEQPEAK